MGLPRFLSSTVTKVLVTVLVLVVLALSVDLRTTIDAIVGADVRWLLPALLTLLLIRVIMAFRWWIILSAYGISFGIWKITKVIFITSSLGSVVPMGIGQDVLRGYHVVRDRGRISEVSASLIVDRAIGLISLAIVALLAAVLGLRSMQDSRSVWVALAASVAILSGVAGLYLGRRGIRRWCRMEDRAPTKRVAWLKGLVASIVSGPIKGKTLTSILLLSVVVQLARTVTFVLVFTSLGAKTDLRHYFVVIPVVFMILLVPVSLGGLGVREGALVLLLGDVGFSSELCVAGGLVFQALQLVAFVPGLVLFMFDSDRPNTRAAR